MIRCHSFIPLILLTILFSGSSLYGQQAGPSKMPIDEVTRLVSYKEVVNVPQVSKKELQQRAFIWANEYYKNPSDVIRERDTVGGKMVCKARLKIKNEADKKGIITEAGLIEYTLTLEFKDNRYRYVITDINWKQKSYFPVEKWMKADEPGYQPSYPYYLEQTEQLMKQLIKDLQKGMGQALVKPQKDNW